MADNRSYVYRRLRRELGLTPAQAAGAVGGLGGESGRTLDPNAVNPTSGALGIGQWLGGRARGVRKGDVRSQTDHLIAELRGPERSALSQLKRAHSIEDATSAWVRAFERPSASEIASSMPARLKYAQEALTQLGGSGGSSLPAAVAGTRTKTVIPGATIRTTIPTVDQAGFEQARKTALIGQMIARRNPNSFLLRSGLLTTAEPSLSAFTGSKTVTDKIPGATVVSAGSPDASGRNTGPASSSRFGKSHSPLLELIHNTGSGPGFAVKNGQVVSGTQVYGDVWAGHKDHVHVAAGPKTVVELGRLAQQMGLSVGENPHFGTVHRVHAPNSYHYKGEAIDVSGNPQTMNRYAAEVERRYGLHR
jgi:hypothetical protein